MACKGAASPASLSYEQLDPTEGTAYEGAADGGFHGGFRGTVYEAAEDGDMERIACLLACGESPDDPCGVFLCPCQKTAIHAAMMNGNVSCMKLLARAGADLNATSQFDLTPIMWAAGHGAVSSLRVLIEAGAYLNYRCEVDGRTALMRAAQYGQMDCLRVLVQAGAELHHEGHDGKTAL